MSGDPHAGGLSAALDAVAQALDRHDSSALDELVGHYVRLLRAEDSVSLTTYRLLTLLLKHRRYEAVTRIAEAALAVTPGDRVVLLAYAQVLVDEGRTAPALHFYTSVAGDPASSAADRAEARGGVGRCYKQLALTEKREERRAYYLENALEAYGGLYRADPTSYWHGINVVALLSYADRESITLRGVLDPGSTAREAASEILSTLKDVADRSDPWVIATECEAHLARGDLEEALVSARRLEEAEGTDSFTIGSLLRQLQSVWLIDPGSSVGTTLLPVLRSTQARFAGSSITLGSQDVTTERLDRIENLEHTAEGDLLERVFGSTRFQTLRWWRNGLMRCRAVVRIDDLNGAPVGTGFMVKGEALHSSLPALVVVTNCHVVPDGVRPEHAVVAFHGLDADESGPKSFRVKRLWWHSPVSPPGFDTAVIELDGVPHNVEPIPLESNLLLQNDKSRAYVIGHPLGYDQPQFSIEDNLLLDSDSKRLHYRSPTEKGSSGSPVFEAQWNVIGLHHAGSNTMSCLTKPGTHSANEALRIDAIREAIKKNPPECGE